MKCIFKMKSKIKSWIEWVIWIDRFIRIYLKNSFIENDNDVAKACKIDNKKNDFRQISNDSLLFPTRGGSLVGGP